MKKLPQSGCFFCHDLKSWRNWMKFLSEIFKWFPYFLVLENSKSVEKNAKLGILATWKFGYGLPCSQRILENQWDIWNLELTLRILPSDLICDIILWGKISLRNFFSKRIKNMIFVAFPKSQTCCSSVHYHV